MSDRRRILVVDDESDVREFLTAVLESGGYDVATAENGKVALDKIRSEEPDLDVIIRKTRERFILGAHKACQIAREVRWANVHLYSAMPEEWVRTYRMHPIADPAAIDALVERAKRVRVIPEATLTLPVVSNKA